STVGTVTEVHDYLALLFAKVGQVVCNGCGAVVEPADPSTVARAVDAFPAGTRYQIAFPLDVRPDSDRSALAEALRAAGFARARFDGRTVALESEGLPATAGGVVDVIVDRLVRGSEAPGRRLDSIETAFAKGLGRCRVLRDAGDLTFFAGRRC